MTYHLDRKKNFTTKSNYLNFKKIYIKDHENRKQMIVEHNECDIININVQHKWTSKMLQKYENFHVIEIIQQIDEQIIKLNKVSKINFFSFYRYSELIQKNFLCQNIIEVDTFIVKSCKTKRKRTRKIIETKRKNNWLFIVLMRSWFLKFNKKIQTFIFALLSWTLKKIIWTTEIECFLFLQRQRFIYIFDRLMKSFTYCWWFWITYSCFRTNFLRMKVKRKWSKQQWN